MLLLPTHREALLHIARATIRRVLANRESATPVPEDPALLQPAGCFVSLHALASHKLRGCVGRLEANAPLYQAVAEAAERVLGDPRFDKDPVRLEEIDSLELEISVLSPLRPLDDPSQFDLHEEGVYLMSRGQAGCFLPQVARETGWSREQLLARLCTEKMGLPPSALRDPSAKLWAFSVWMIGPVPFETSAIHRGETTRPETGKLANNPPAHTV